MGVLEVIATSRNSFDNLVACRFSFSHSLLSIRIAALGHDSAPLHSNVKIGVAFRAFSLALLPKYIPGKILAHGIRAQLCVNAGVPIATALNSLLIEALFAVGSAAVLSLPLLFIYQSLGSDYLLIWVFGAGTVLLLLFLRSQKNFASLLLDTKPSQRYTTVFTYARILLDLTLLWFMIVALSIGVSRILLAAILCGEFLT